MGWGWGGRGLWFLRDLPREVVASVGPSCPVGLRRGPVQCGGGTTVAGTNRPVTRQLWYVQNRRCCRLFNIGVIGCKCPLYRKYTLRALAMNRVFLGVLQTSITMDGTKVIETARLDFFTD